MSLVHPNGNKRPWVLRSRGDQDGILLGRIAKSAMGVEIEMLVYQYCSSFISCLVVDVVSW